MSDSMDDYIAPSTLKQRTCTTASIMHFSEGDDSKSSVSYDNQNIEDIDNKDNYSDGKKLLVRLDNSHRPTFSAKKFRDHVI
jgi:hypothetical protein